MTTHPYWGDVEEDWAGFSAEATFSYPFFIAQNSIIFLGEAYDDDGEEVDEAPNSQQLDTFAATYQSFLAQFEVHLQNIQAKAVERYQKLYAHYYENPEKSGEPALQIDNIEKHNNYIKEIMQLRVLEDDTLKLSIRYKIDTEHGLEFRFESGEIVAVGGIAET